MCTYSFTYVTLYGFFLQCCDIYALPSMSLVHRWENGGLMRLRSGNLLRGQVGRYRECWDLNSAVLLFVCSFVSLCMLWIKYTNTESSVDLRPNPSLLWKDLMKKGRCERQVLNEALWSYNSREQGEDSGSFPGLGRRARSSVVCMVFILLTPNTLALQLPKISKIYF